MASLKQTDIAFVTGAGSGIGRQTCLLLAQRGATVVAADINIQAAQQTVTMLPGPKHTAMALDVTKKEDVGKAFSAVTKKYSSPPNIVINCAGLMLVKPLLQQDADSYDKVFDVNVKGTVWVTQAACSALVAAKKRGSIVNIASVAKNGCKALSVYAATKGAVDAFSRSVAKEFGQEGIRCNFVSPGYTDTPMMTVFPEAFKKAYNDSTSLGRTAEPQEIAEVLVFLGSESSSYVNGECICVDGGRA